MSNEQIVLIPITVNELLDKVKEVISEALKTNQEIKLQGTLLSPTETCKIFSPTISKVTLYEWTKQGLIPSYRIGGRVYYNYGEVIESAKRIRKFDRDKVGYMK